MKKFVQLPLRLLVSSISITLCCAIPNHAQQTKSSAKSPFEYVNPFIGTGGEGKPFDRSYITHREIMNGGELVFTMSGKPNTAWATGKEFAPYSMTK
jgi:putative alpha-1,2-mannosidase